MGCFSVSCGISGRAMYSDDCVLIPLVRGQFDRRKGRDIQVSGSNLISNEGPKIFFSPLTLPIYGNMNSYGRLEGIKEDANTKAIEKFFHVDIDSFAEAIAYGGFEDNTTADDEAKKNPLLKNPVGMFVHQDIYKALTLKCPDDMRGADDALALNSSYLIDETLRIMGFEYKGSNQKELKLEDGEQSWDAEKKLTYEQQEKRRYHHKWVHPEIPEVVVWTDNRWGRLQKVGSRKYESIYGPAKLMAAIKKMTGKEFPKNWRAKLDGLLELEVVYEAAKKEIEEAKEAEKIWQDARERRKGKGEADETEPFLTPRGLSLGMSDHARSVMNLWEYGDVEGIMHFLALYGDDLDAIKPPMVRHKIFERNMFGCNKFYFPTFCGPQMGNLEAEILLNNATAALLKKEHDEAVKARMEDGDEDDTDE